VASRCSQGCGSGVLRPRSLPLLPLATASATNGYPLATASPTLGAKTPANAFAPFAPASGRKRRSRLGFCTSSRSRASIGETGFEPATAWPPGRRDGVALSTCSPFIPQPRRARAGPSANPWNAWAGVAGRRSGWRPRVWTRTPSARWSRPSGVGERGAGGGRRHARLGDLLKARVECRPPGGRQCEAAGERRGCGERTGLLDRGE